jgi:hypothetical protein
MYQLAQLLLVGQALYYVDMCAVRGSVGLQREPL